jgi:hypothetical protein
MRKSILTLVLLLLLFVPAASRAQLAGTSGVPELVLAADRASKAVIVVAADAGPWEKKAAADLRKYIGLMSGAQLPVIHAIPKSGPALVVGKSALADRATATALRRIVKKDPLVQADAVSVRRKGNRVYLAGSNDESHYFAVSWLLQQWGCRWYMPTQLGEVVPQHKRLAVGALDYAHAPPFEIRRYWISWNGDQTGADDFRHRNFMSDATLPMGHALEAYTAEIAPPGGTHFNVPFTDPRTAEHVAAKIETEYAAGKDISLAIADGNYSNDYPGDRALGGQFDPYMLTASLTDPMMTFYNNVARILRRKYPASRARILALAYANVTMPPRKVTAVEPNVVMWIAPIDIDPNHAMDDPRSPPRLEYRKMVESWAKLLGGRLAIYDYDQGMLVWRDVPNPSHHVFARDAKIYRAAGILGVQTESRGAFATTFLNLFFRGQLMWDPDADVAGLLAEFYPKFYGPAAEPMTRYWGRIFRAWEATGVTEHEHMALPAIYTPELVASLGEDLAAAESALAASTEKEAVLLARMRFTRAVYEVLATYVPMIAAAARDADYGAAAAAGEKAIAARDALAALSPLFVQGIVGGEGESAAWLPGEVRQFRELRGLADGSKGTLVARLPLGWSFKVEKPLPPDWTYKGVEGPHASADIKLALEEPLEAAGWRQVRSDLYLQGQGVFAADGQSHLGHYWYQSSVDLEASDAGAKTRLMFPGLFNEAWLYVNGKLVAHRPYNEPWWRSDYRFEWDVDISAHLQPGKNVIALRGFNPHHFGGLFRRPFLYRPN